MVIVSKRAIRFFSWVLGAEEVRGIAFFPFIFLWDEKDLNNQVLINHEKIHLRQQIEMGIIPFYIWYVIALNRVGYWNISMEKEAYANEKNLTYLDNRRIFAFRKYLK